jgi:hypothetical protein
MSPPLTGGRPQEWLPHIAKLRRNKKWHEVEMLVETYILLRDSIYDILVLKRTMKNEHSNFQHFDDTILGWCQLYNILGEACFKQQKFEKAEKAHMSALCLHLCVHSEGAQSSAFRINVHNLRRALLRQGSAKQHKLETIQNSFSEILVGQQS